LNSDYGSVSRSDSNFGRGTGTEILRGKNPRVTAASFFFLPSPYPGPGLLRVREGAALNVLFLFFSFLTYLTTHLFLAKERQKKSYGKAQHRHLELLTDIVCCNWLLNSPWCSCLDE